MIFCAHISSAVDVYGHVCAICCKAQLLTRNSFARKSSYLPLLFNSCSVHLVVRALHTKHDVRKGCWNAHQASARVRGPHYHGAADQTEDTERCCSRLCRTHTLRAAILRRMTVRDHVLPPRSAQCWGTAQSRPQLEDIKYVTELASVRPPSL